MRQSTITALTTRDVYGLIVNFGGSAMGHVRVDMNLPVKVELGEVGYIWELCRRVPLLRYHRHLPTHSHTPFHGSSG